MQVLTEVTGGSGTGWYGKSDYSKINNSSATMRWLNVSVRATPTLKSQKGYLHQNCGKSSSILLMG
jgi:hypothetical protein